MIAKRKGGAGLMKEHPVTCETQASSTLVKVLQNTVSCFPERGIAHVVAGSDTEDFQSYLDLMHQAKRVAGLLYRKGVFPGDHVILVPAGSRAFLTLFWGCVMGGIVPVPLPHVRIAKAESMEVQKLFNVWSLVEAPVVLDSKDEQVYPMLSELFRRTGASILAADELLLEAGITSFGDEELYAPSFEEVAVLQFSSGSTGLPKGAEITHANLISNIKAKLKAEGGSEDDSLVTWLPYFHDFGLFGCHLMPLYAGMQQVKMAPSQFARRPFLWMEKIHQHRAAITGSTNTGVEHLVSFLTLKGEHVPQVDLSCLRAFSVGAEMVSRKACEKLADLLAKHHLNPSCFVPGYGLTETTLVATSHPLNEPVKSFRVDRKRMMLEGVIEYSEGSKDAAEFVSVGFPVEDCEIRIVDHEGNILPAARVGVVEIKGGNVTRGYYNNPEANEEVLNGAWFSTGDLGFLSEEGELSIIGRSKEVIVIHGNNYYPFDIEQIALKGFEDSIKTVIVCGLYDFNALKEKVILFYVPDKKYKNSAGSLDSILVKMNEQIAEFVGFSIDHFIAISNKDIPRTSSGKIMRRVLTDNFLKGNYKEMMEIKKIEQNEKEFDPGTINHESVVRRVWSEVLEIPGEEITLDQNLLKIGGDSIKTMRIQGLLEDFYKAKTEANFCYLFPTLGRQIEYFGNRDFSIEPPQTEFEVILQSVVADQLKIKKESLGVTANVISKTRNLSDMIRIVNEVKRVFAIDELPEEFLRLKTVREMADYFWKIFIGEYRSGDKSGEPFPLMNFQETLYFHRKGFVKNEPSGLSCYIFVNVYMHGEIRLDVFNEALNYVISRHPVLRSVINEEEERPRMQVLDSVPEVKVKYVDISTMPREEQRGYIESVGLKGNDYRFEINKWPLLYAEIYKLAENEYDFVFDIDHLLVDGFSFMQVMDELFNTYDKMCQGKRWELPEVPMAFKEYVLIEKLRQRTPEYARAMQSQLEFFKDLPPKAVLPFKCNPALIENVFFDTHYQEIEPEIIDGLNKLSIDYQVSLNSILFAAYFKLMNIWCHQDDLIINMPVFNREQYFAGARTVVGSFIDIFPVRLQTYFGEPVMEIAGKAEMFTRELLKVPVSSIELSRRIFEREGLRATSLSSIIFSNSIGMYAGEISNMDTLVLETPEFRTGAPGTFLDLVIYDYKERLDAGSRYYFNWNFIRDLFDKSFIETLAVQYRTILMQLCEQHKTNGLQESFTGNGIMPERHRLLLADMNETAMDYPRSTLHELIAEQVRLSPEKVAMTFEDKVMTYRELQEESNRIAWFLINEGVKPGDFVALLAGRSIDMVVGQLGILKAGGAYVPIDVDYPSERVGYVLEDSGAKILLTDSQYVSKLEGVELNLERILILDAEESPETPIAETGSCAVTCGREIGRYSSSDVQPISGPDSNAYMIYTSGSTGKPKGVMVRHKNIINFLNWVKQEFAVHADERFAFLTSYAFDMTLTSNWVPFLAGASLHILSEENTRNVEALLRFISAKQITFLNVTPSHFSLIANARDYMGDEPLELEKDMRVMLGGELINVKDLNLWLRYYPAHSFINEYGPTEATVASTFYPIPKNESDRIEMEIVPIGKPVYNTQVYVLNEQMQPCMVGVAGQLWIGGDGVAVGYHNKPEKTSEVFVPDPFSGTGDLMYGTGDMVRLLDDGNIEFLGRRDFQINLRGYRIEAAEIETVMREYGPITEAVVVPRKDSDGNAVLVAFYTAARNEAVAASEIRKFLGGQLPAYMIPVHFECLEKMPTTPSKKLDINKLPDVVVEVDSHDDERVKPQTELEKKLTSVWEEVLGVKNLGIHDNFWEVGGDSLKAMRLITRIKKEGYIDFGLREAFEYQTVASIVEYIEKKNGAAREEDYVIRLKSPANSASRLLCLPYACGNPTMYSDFNKLMPDNYEILGANLPGHDGIGEPVASITKIAETYAGLLEKPDDNRNFILGYSFGGYLAYEIARILEERNRPVAGLIIVASPPPGVKEGLVDILDSSDEEIIEYSKQVYDYDFSHMTEDERRDYLKTLKIDTLAMVDFVFGKRVSAPTLILVGESEEEEDVRIHKEKWGEACEQCLFEEVPGKHMLIKTHTKQLADRVRGFVESVVLVDAVHSGT
ncbi:MAG: amino acid adenylation domain-containing protein [Chlorobiales bacterium]|nr:amino acid adenylation domain-containing protein [Chlorobiales bacterium]